MAEYSIVNLVANTEIEEQLDLYELNRRLDNCRYEPKSYFALIYRLNKPKLSILVNSSGKIIFTGAKSENDIILARNLFFKDMFVLGYKPKKKKILLQNIVVTSNLNLNLNLEKIALTFQNIEYTPEIFPGLILKNSNPRFSCLIFRNGKVTISGLKKIEDVEPILDIVYKIVSEG